MPNFIRIINRPFWPRTDEIMRGFDVDNLEARTISNEFRNKDNTLSLWDVENEEDAVLAITVTAQKINDVWTLRIDDKIIEGSNLEIKNEESHPNVKGIGKFHYNIKNLTYKKLADVSNIIIEALKDENNLKEYTEDDIIRILKNAIEQGRVNPKFLSPAIQKKLQN